MTDVDPAELRELFDPEDERDQWVFMLAMTLADLGTYESIFKRHLWADDTPDGYRLFLQRWVGSRLFEARRVVMTIVGNADLEAFIEEAGAKEDADWLRAKYERGDKEESEVEEVFQEQRNLTVHHAKVNSDEMKEMLRRAADEAVQIERNEEREREVLAFPEAVLTRMILGDENGKLDPEVLAARASFADAALRRFGNLWLKVFGLHVRRKGVDPQRLFRIVPKPSGP